MHTKRLLYPNMKSIPRALSLIPDPRGIHGSIKRVSIGVLRCRRESERHRMRFKFRLSISTIYLWAYLSVLRALRSHQMINQYKPGRRRKPSDRIGKLRANLNIVNLCRVQVMLKRSRVRLLLAIKLNGLKTTSVDQG